MSSVRKGIAILRKVFACVEGCCWKEESVVEKQRKTVTFRCHVDSVVF